MRLIIFSFLIAVFASPIHARDKKIVPKGKFTPLYGIEKNQKDFEISSFSIDVFPVTAREFNAFLSKNPEWKKENISDLLSDSNYLSVISAHPKSAITRVSWFAANAFCEAQNGRLPTTLEWEYVAAASQKSPNALTDSEYVQKILNWYAHPAKANEQFITGKGSANYYGLFDMHGLIWEWTSDFNSVIINSDNRNDGDKNAVLTCGAGAMGASTKEDYAGFIRYSLRNSLRANYSLNNLGFRCAYDL